MFSHGHNVFHGVILRQMVGALFKVKAATGLTSRMCWTTQILPWGHTCVVMFGSLWRRKEANVLPARICCFSNTKLFCALLGTIPKKQQHGMESRSTGFTFLGKCCCRNPLGLNFGALQSSTPLAKFCLMNVNICMPARHFRVEGWGGGMTC